MSNPLDELVSISRLYGGDPEFVLAGGGNTSYKTADILYAKASGVSMADITTEGFVSMDRAKLSELWHKSYPEVAEQREALVLNDMLACRAEGAETKRPSVETLLHDLIPHPYVVHTHPALINGVGCARNGQKAARELFGEHVVWIPVTAPGFILAVRARESVEAYRNANGRDPKAIVIQNHGVFIGGGTAQEIESVTNELCDRVRAAVTRRPDAAAADDAPAREDRATQLAPALRMLLKPVGGTSIVVYRCHREIARVIDSEESFYPLSSAFTPDHIVYYGRAPLFVPYESDIDKQFDVLARSLERHRTKRGSSPRIVAVEKIGLFAWGESKARAETSLALCEDAIKVAVYTESFGGPLFMPEQQISFIESWEAERFRRQVIVGGDGAESRGGPRLEQKICIVTGGAQGFGQGIATALAGEGANLILADVNEPLARESAAALCEAHGPGRSVAIGADVSDEASVKSMIRATVLAYGGLDIYLSNAGVLRAGGLEEMTPETFEFVTRVNYLGYFLGAKHASSVMKLQHRFDPGYYMDIVQINSKSGLQGSSRNFAYAGGKFGGIGLTESFALELVEYNIKVNAICPGNFFDGPLWSDPERGLFVQYLGAGKVPGAKTVADVKRFYESKVPMQRGCTVRDVARALLYVVEQEYETGQALPVTGGQVMLK